MRLALHAPLGPLSLALACAVACGKPSSTDAPSTASASAAPTTSTMAKKPEPKPAPTSSTSASSASSSAPARKALADLINTADPGWPIVTEMVAKAKNKVEALPVDPKRGEQALPAIQVTTRSPMGAIAYASGGLLVDGGWIRVLGGGSPRLPRDLGSWNFPKGVDQPLRLPDAMLIADDALGGFFALNGGAFKGPLGNVFYFAPDTLRWEDLGRGYTAFLDFLCQGDLAKFYDGHRWRTHASDVEKLAGDRAYSIYPPLWAKEGGTIEQRSRKDVPIEELWSLEVEHLGRQLEDAPNGTKVELKVTP